MAAGENGPLRVVLDRRLTLEFYGPRGTSDAGLSACRELDEALGLTTMAAEVVTDRRTGSNTQHSLVALLRQSVFSRLAGYEDTNDAERLAVDSAMRHVVGLQPTAAGECLLTILRDLALPATQHLRPQVPARGPPGRGCGDLRRPSAPPSA